MTPSFDFWFSGVLRMIEENEGIFGILMNLRARSKCFICKKYWFENLTLFDLTLTCPPSKLRLDDVIGSNDNHYRYMRARPRNHVSHGMFATFILQWRFVTWRWSFLICLFIHTAPFVDMYGSTLWVGLSSLHSVWPTREPKMWKLFLLTFNLTLTWTLMLAF